MKDERNICEDVRFPTSPYQFSVQLLKYTGRENDKGLEENVPGLKSFQSAFFLVFLANK